MNAIKRIVCLFGFAIGMCVLAGSAMAFDFGGMMKEVQKAVADPQPEAAKQPNPEQNKTAQPSASKAAQGNLLNITASGGLPKSAEEYCQRITTSPSIIKLADEMRILGADSYEVQQSYLDNHNRDLEKWVAENILKYFDISKDYNRTKVRDGTYRVDIDIDKLREMKQWGNKCIKDAAKDSALGVITGNKKIDALFDSTNMEIYKSGRLNENPSNYLNATILAFLFPSVEDTISKVSPEIGASFKLAAKERAESIKRAAIEEDIKLYGGVRAVYKFRTNPALSSAYSKCVLSEKDYQLKVAADAESEAKKLNTAAEQNKVYGEANHIKKNIDYIAHGMCVYRLNVGLSSLAAGIQEFSAVMQGNQFGRGEEDLNSKYTPAALGKVADILNMPAEKFHKTKINEPVDNEIKRLSNLRPTTSAQQQDINSEIMQMKMVRAIIHGGIWERIIDPLIMGKIQTSEEKFEATKRKAEAGDADAQSILGYIYEKGDGVPKDAAKAAVWYQKAAAQGNARAQTNLGYAYWIGSGVSAQAKQSK